MPTTYNGTIFKPTSQAVAMVESKDPPVHPPKTRKYPITPPGGSWVKDEMVTFQLENNGGKETAINVAKKS